MSYYFEFMNGDDVNDVNGDLYMKVEQLNFYTRQNSYATMRIEAAIKNEKYINKERKWEITDNVIDQLSLEITIMISLKLYFDQTDIQSIVSHLKQYNILNNELARMINLKTGNTIVNLVTSDSILFSIEPSKEIPVGFFFIETMESESVWNIVYLFNPKNIIAKQSLYVEYSNNCINMAKLPSAYIEYISNNMVYIVIQKKIKRYAEWQFTVLYCNKDDYMEVYIKKGTPIIKIIYDDVKYFYMIKKGTIVYNDFFTCESLELCSDYCSLYYMQVYREKWPKIRKHNVKKNNVKIRKASRRRYRQKHH